MFKLGKLTFKNNVFLAPMAGYGDIAFRRLCADYGAGLTVTEMVSAKGLVYNNENTQSLLRLADNETPSCVQLFGGEPEVFRKAVQLDCLHKFDIIDINMGCPVAKIVKNHEGSALGADPVRAAECVAAVKTSGKTVTAKIRLGFEQDEFTAVKLAQALERAGADMIYVHGRYAKQMYRGKSDWDKIYEIKKAIGIPVFGNGDICNATVAQARLNGGVDGVMIGRGALGHPDIFAEVSGGVGGRLLDVILKHIDYMLEYFTSRYTAVNMRKHLAYYLHGVPDTKELKQKLNFIDDADTLKELLTQRLSVLNIIENK